jgi:hypothetical protein
MNLPSSRVVRPALLAVSVLALLANASCIMKWDGAFPSAVVPVLVTDSSGQPVPRAQLQVYDHRTREKAFGYPIDNFTEDSSLTTDDSGTLTAYHCSTGLEFGGTTWYLFGSIPIGARRPRYDCEIVAAGYKPVRFEVMELFQAPPGSYEDFPKTTIIIDGEPTELPVYGQRQFTLERDE